MKKVFFYTLLEETAKSFCKTYSDFSIQCIAASSLKKTLEGNICVWGNKNFKTKKSFSKETTHIFIAKAEADLHYFNEEFFNDYILLSVPESFNKKKIFSYIWQTKASYDKIPTHMKLVEQLHDSVLLLSTDGIVHEANPHFFKITQYSPDEFYFKHISTFFPDTDFASLISESIQKSILKEAFLLTKQNNFIPKEIRVSAIEISNKTMIVLVARDIRERLKAIKKLEESEERFRTIIKHSPNGMIIFKNDIISYINLCGIEILDGNYEDFIDQSFIKLISEAHKDSVLKILKNKKKGSVSKGYNISMISKSDQEVRVHISSIPIEVQGSINYFILFQDITEQEKTLHNLETTDIRLREIQKIAKLGHWEHNILKNNLYWSDEVYKIYEVTPEDFTPTYETVLQFVHEDDRDTVRHAYSNSLTTREPYEIVHRIVMNNGNLKYINEKCSTIFDSDGKPIRSLGTVMDITHTIKTEKALEQTKEQFELLFENLDQPFLICKPIYNIEGEIFDFEITDVNPACRNLFHGKYKNILGRTILEIFYNPYFWIDKYKKTLFSKETVTFRKYSTDLHKYLDIILYPVKDSTQIAGIYTDVTQKVYAENQLQDLTSRMQQIQEYAKIGSYDVNIINKHSKWSTVMLSIFEYPLNLKPSYELYLERIHPDDREHVRYVYAQSIKQKEFDASLDFRLLFPDGRIKHIYTEFTNTFEGKTCLNTKGWLQDVTDLQHAVSALKESEEKLRMVTSGTRLGLWEWDLQNEDFNLDDIGCSMLGFVPEEIWGDQSIYLSLVHKSDRALFNKVLKRFYSKSQRLLSIEYRIKMKNGRYKWISSVGIALEHNELHKPVKIIGFNQDISSRKKVEAALRDSENKFRRIFEIENDSLFLVDIKTHKIIEINNAVSELYGYKRKELLNKNFYSLSTNPQRLYSYIAKKTKRINNEHALLKNGQNCPVEISLAYFTWKGTSVLLAAVRDISERHRFQQELVFAKEKAEESDKLKSSFLANMSHEIRTPLNAIVGFSRLLARKNYPQEKRKIFIDDIQANSNQLLTIINDILDISKIESGQFLLSYEPVCINKVLQEIYDSFLVQLKDKNIVLKCISPLTDAETIINIDEVRLKQVLSNLLHNAIKFTEKGSVTFGYNENPQQNIVFFVKDTGIGIAPDKQEIIFEHFRQEDDTTTRTYGGTGIGLSISKRLVELMKGSIWIESEKGKGATFFVSIPYELLQKEELIVEERILNNNTRTSSFNNENVLVCDNVDSSFIFLSEILEQENLTILQAKSGIDAIEICSTSQSIDIIFMDIQMPGLSGVETMQKIKKTQPHIPIIAQTAFAQKGDRERFIAEGFDEYVTKPLNEYDVRNILMGFLPRKKKND